MSQNPLQQYFRQPKMYISLPSKGMYNKVGSIDGDPLKVPVCSMTGGDEILMKTPDALLSGETSVRIFESCCPSIKDGWDISMLDADLILTAIRIATSGSKLSLVNQCQNPECGEFNDYDFDLSVVLDHFSKCKYDNKLVLNDLTIKIQPLSYKQNSEFSLRNFGIQQRMRQVAELADEEKRKAIVAELFDELRVMQTEIFTASIAAIDTDATSVTQQAFIKEWVENCDKSVFDELKAAINKNKEIWRIPKIKVGCSDCGTEAELSIELDQSNFFGNA